MEDAAHAGGNCRVAPPALEVCVGEDVTDVEMPQPQLALVFWGTVSVDSSYLVVVSRGSRVLNAWFLHSVLLLCCSRALFLEFCMSHSSCISLEERCHGLLWYWSVL